MILYIENPKDYIHTHTINELNEVTRYKINTQKNQLFFYILTMNIQKEN